MRAATAALDTLLRRGSAAAPRPGPVVAHTLRSHQRRYKSSSTESNGNALRQMRLAEQIHAAVQEHVPLRDGVTVAALAHALPDELMESAFPQGLLRFLQAHPQHYLLAAGPRGVIVKRFLQQRSDVLRSAGLASPGRPRAPQARSPRMCAAAAAEPEVGPSCTVAPLLPLWEVFRCCRDTARGDGATTATTAADGVPLLLSAVQQQVGCVQLYCLAEHLSAAGVLLSFRWLEEAIRTGDDVRTSPLGSAAAVHLDREPGSEQPHGVPPPPGFSAGDALRLSFFLRAGGVALRRVLDALLHATASASPRRGTALRAAREMIDAVEWDAVLDYEALRLCPYLSTAEATPLRSLTLPPAAEMVATLTRPLAATLAVYAALQTCGDVPYTRHRPEAASATPPPPSVFAWEAAPAPAVHPRVGSSGWVTGVRFALDDAVCLPADCFRPPDDVHAELAAVQAELREVRQLRRCGAFQRRLHLTNRRRHLLICTAILCDPVRYAVYHGDVLAYYLFDRLPASCEPGQEWAAVFPYNDLAGLLPAPLDRRALISSMLLRCYPHLFVPFQLQGQRVVVRRDVFESVRAVHTEQLRRCGGAAPAWLGRPGAPSLTAAEPSALAPFLFDPALRIASAEELAHHLAHLIALRRARGGRRKTPGSYPCSLESLREMLPRHFSAMLRRICPDGSAPAVVPVPAKAPRRVSSAEAPAAAGQPSKADDPLFLHFLAKFPHIFLIRDDTYVELAPDLDVKHTEPSARHDTKK